MMVSSAKNLTLEVINNITAKANKTLEFLRRNLKIPSIRIKEQAYQTLVRPSVEYASTGGSRFQSLTVLGKRDIFLVSI
jgi:hypothetical protein